MFWVRTRDRECAELQEAEGKELHGSSTRTVQVRHANPSFRTWVSYTGRAREKLAQHGSPARTVFVNLAQHGSPARGVSERRANLFFRTRGVLLNTDRVVRLACMGLRRFLHGACQVYFQHGACRLARVTLGSARVKLGFARVVQFSFF